MSFFLAAASSDGQNIDRHFGHSDSFSIVRAEDDGSYELQERRSVDSPCQHGFHEEGAMLRAVEALADCRYVLAEAVGHGSREQELHHGGEDHQRHDPRLQQSDEIARRGLADQGRAVHRGRVVNKGQDGL